MVSTVLPRSQSASFSWSSMLPTAFTAACIT